MARMVAAFATGVAPWYAEDHPLLGRQCAGRASLDRLVRRVVVPGPMVISQSSNSAVSVLPA